MTRNFVAALGLIAFLACFTNSVRGDALVRGDLEETGAVEIGSALSLARPDLFSRVDSTALIRGLPVLTLLDGRRFPISTELGRMGMTPFEFLPVAFLSAVHVQKGGNSLRHGSDGAGGTVDLRLNRLQTAGEVGFFYGRSDGKYGREDYSAHIIGSVGTDRFNITAARVTTNRAAIFRARNPASRRRAPQTASCAMRMNGTAASVEEAAHGA